MNMLEKLNIIKIEDLDKKEVREYIRDNIIQYEYIDREKVVSEDFMLKMDNLDPIDLIEKITNEKIDNNLGHSLVFMHMKRVIREEIAKLNYDVSSSCSLNEYKKCIKINGFKKIFEKKHEIKSDGYFESKESMDNYAEKNNLKITSFEVENEQSGKIQAKYIRTEHEYIYWNEEYSFLLHFDTYGDGVNSSKLSTNMKPKEGERNFDIGISGGYINGTNIMHSYFDMRDQPARKIKQILIRNEPIKDWLSYDIILHCGYTQHRAEYEDINFTENAANTLKELPKEILDKLFASNIQTRKEKKKLMEQGINFDYKYEKEVEFYKTLSAKELRQIEAKKVLLEINHNSLSKRLINKAIKFGCDLENIKISTLLIETKGRRSLLKEDFINAVNDFSKDELEKLEKIEINMFNKEEITEAKKHGETKLKILNLETTPKLKKPKA